MARPTAAGHPVRPFSVGSCYPQGRSYGRDKDADPKLDKEQIIDFLTSLGRDDDARAEPELPDKVGTHKDRGLLEKFGVDRTELLTRRGRSFGL